MSVSAKRNAKIELTASSAGMDRGLADAKRKLRAFERDQARQAKQADREATKSRKKAERDAAKSRKEMAGNVRSGVIQGAMTMVGVDGIAGFATDILDYEKALTRLQITADQSPEAMRAFSDGVMRASNATGINRAEVLGAASQYVALTGDMETAQRATSAWARIAQATGTPIADIASTAAAMTQQLGITAGDMETVFGGLAAQGKAGAIELKDLAGLMSQIAPMWAQFNNGKGARGVADLGAALQIVKRGFGGDASETVTGLQSLLVALTKHGGKIESVVGKGSVFETAKDGSKHLKDVFSIINAIGNSKLAKDPEALEKAFGRVEAYRAYLQLVQNKDALQQMVDVAHSGAGLIQRDFDTYITSPSGKIEQAWNRVKNAIAAAMTPERVEGFASAVQGLAENLVPVLEAVSKIGGVLGSLYGVGQKIRGAFDTAPNPFGGPANDPMGDDILDQKTISSGGRVSPAGEWSSEARPEMVLLAQNRLANRHGYADARDAIMAAEIGDAMSPASIKAAFAAKYGANAGGQRAGASYLKAAHIQDPAEAARAGLANVSAVAAQQRGLVQIRDAIREGFAAVGIKIGAEPIQKAGANSINHRRGK